MTSLAEVRRALIEALEQAERELREQRNNAQRRAEAQARRVIAQTTQCAIELEAQMEELASQLDQTRVSVAQIRERLGAELRRLEEESLVDEEPTDQASGEPTAEGGTEEEPVGPVNTDDTVRVLRAALDALSRQRNGGV